MGFIALIFHTEAEMIDVLVLWVAVRGLVVDRLIEARVQEALQNVKTALLTAAIYGGAMPQVETVRRVYDVGMVAA